MKDEKINFGEKQKDKSDFFSRLMKNIYENYEIINDPIDSDGVHKTRPVATAFGLILDERKNDD